MYPPVLSILMVAYNSSAVLPACLVSVNAGTTLVHEIILVDNASSDGTLAVVKTFAGIRLIANKENIGFAAAANQASRLAKGRYLLLLNPDTVVHDRAIDRLVHFMEAHPSIGIVAPQVVDATGRVVANTQRFHTPGTLFWRALCGGPLAPLARRRWAQLDAQDQRGYAVFGCALLIRSELYRALDGLDERFFLYEEDIDLCYRATLMGWEVRQATDVVITHHGGASSILPGEFPAQARIRIGLQKLRSRSIYAQKHFARRAALFLHLGYAAIGVGMISMSFLHTNRAVRRRRYAIGAESLRVGLSGLR